MHYDKILIDANSIGYAAHCARELNVHGQQIQAVFFSIKMLKKAIERFAGPSTEVIALWDSRAKWRYELHPEYKGKRDDKPEKRESRQQYKRQVPQIREALSLLGVEQRFATGEEADDLAGALVHNKVPGEKILLITGDHDWLQLVSTDVSWFDPREEGRFVSSAEFKSFTSCNGVSAFLQAKAVLGDSSDNINGVDGVGEKCLELLNQHFGGIAGFIEFSKKHAASNQPAFEKGDLPDELSRWRKKLSEFAFGNGMATFKRNLRLMSLVSPRHRSDEIILKQVVFKPPFNEEGFTDFCHERAFLGITRAMKDWCNVFNREVA